MSEPQTIVVAHRPRDAGVMALATPSRGASMTSPRRWPWRTMMVVSLTLAIVASAGIWLTVHPTYRVGAMLHVDPVAGSGSATGDVAVAHYRQHVATEIVNVTSRAVLDATMSTPQVQSLASVRGMSDPAAEIAGRLVATPVDGTQLVEVTMTGDHPSDMAVIVNALVQCYLSHHGRREQARETRITQVLREEEQTLQADLAANAASRQQAASMPGAPPGASIGAIDTRMEQLRQELTRLEQARAVATSRHSALLAARAGGGPVGGDPDELEQFLSTDGDLQILNRQLERIETEAFEDRRMGRSQRHPDVRLKDERLAALRERIRRRESELRDPFVSTMIRKLEAEVADIDTSAAVIAAELDTLARQRARVAERTRLLDNLDHRRRRLEEDHSRVRQKIRDVAVEENKRASVTVRSPARTPSAPNVDHRPVYIAAAAVISLLAGAGVALVRHRPAADFCDPDKFARRAGIRMLGSVESVHGDWVAVHAVDHRLLDPVAGGAAGERPPVTAHARSRMITSAAASRGKSAFAANLARSLSARGRRVLLIDADLESRNITLEMAMLDRKGLADLLNGTTTAGDVAHAGDVDNLTVLPAGASNTWVDERLCTQEAQATLRSVFAGFDEVIIDAPPVLTTGDAVLLASFVDEVILVVQPGKAAERQAQQARRLFDFVGGNVVGVVLDTVTS
ncbi:MAG: AAA family ATPase [Phycisphaerales bacterium]|nr:MAG: AAA family ATPase [Phycisphaerales bacterium]